MIRRFAHFLDDELSILIEALGRATSEFAAVFLAEALVEYRLRRYRGVTPSVPADIEQMLASMEKLIMSNDPNLDAIANDWPALQAAITSRLTSDANTIAQLTSELATAATSTTPMSDSRAAEIDTQMKATIASLTGVASAVNGASPAAGATGATGAIGSTGPVGVTGSTGATASAATGAIASTGATGSTAAAAPGVPPAGSPAN